AVKDFKFSSNQVDKDGFLPNEMKGRQRALSYHNYALPPLAMIASFDQANGVDLRPQNNGDKKRLGDRGEPGVKDPS
ncbi:alginate lyase family protein, partial [Pseudomonas syringae group genomosp. 7]|uniref:alginate lyase family protein n=1 Tax=Pseudomonas syringae group genomosp. 7 TaxID=251699 RepID=UPI00376FC65D